MFAYTRYETEPSRTNSTGVVHRPEVLIRVIGPLGEAHLMALVDTGADASVFPRSLAEELGVHLKSGDETRAAGFGGEPLELVPGEVEIELESESGLCRWPAIVGFVSVADPEGECAILGHVGALEFFFATFDGKNRVGSLAPNENLPAVK